MDEMTDTCLYLIVDIVHTASKLWRNRLSSVQKSCVIVAFFWVRRKFFGKNNRRVCLCFGVTQIEVQVCFQTWFYCVYNDNWGSFIEYYINKEVCLYGGCIYIRSDFRNFCGC